MAKARTKPKEVVDVVVDIETIGLDSPAPDADGDDRINDLQLEEEEDEDDA